LRGEVLAELDQCPGEGDGGRFVAREDEDGIRVYAVMMRIGAM